MSCPPYNAASCFDLRRQLWCFMCLWWICSPFKVVIDMVGALTMLPQNSPFQYRWSISILLHSPTILCWPKQEVEAPQCFLGLKAHLGSPTPACALKPGVQLSPSMGASCSTLMPCLSPQHPQACLTLSQERPYSSQCCRAPWYPFERSTFSDPLV